MPHPATIHALVFESKIKLFLSNKNFDGTQASQPAARQYRDDARWKRAYRSGLLNQFK